jgi:hypothetical protein
VSEITVESLARDRLTLLAERIAVQLELMASRVRDDALGLVDVGSRSRYCTAVGDIVESIEQGIAKLSLSSMIVPAMEADLDRALRLAVQRDE